jgi:hypothetical protein
MTKRRPTDCVRERRTLRAFLGGAHRALPGRGIDAHFAVYQRPEPRDVVERGNDLSRLGDRFGDAARRERSCEVVDEPPNRGRGSEAVGRHDSSASCSSTSASLSASITGPMSPSRNP